MADVAQIVGSLMSELIQAQKSAMNLTKEIAENQKEDPIMGMLPVPGLRIDNFDLSLKFVIDDEQDTQLPNHTSQDDTADEKAASNGDDEIEQAKREAVIRTLAGRSVTTVLTSDEVKSLITKTKMTAQEQRVLQTRLANALISATAKDSTEVNNDKTLKTTKTYLAKSKLKAQADQTIVNSMLEKALTAYQKDLKTHLGKTAKTSQPTTASPHKPKLVVDKALLGKVSNEKISTLNMSLSMDEYEWIESENGLILKAIQ